MRVCWRTIARVVATRVIDGGGGIEVRNEGELTSLAKPIGGDGLSGQSSQNDGDLHVCDGVLLLGRGGEGAGRNGQFVEVREGGCED